MFLVFSNHFDVLMSKMIFKKKKKHHWHAFWHEKLFEKQPQPHCQTNHKSQRQTRVAKGVSFLF
jgi:hypothetical protein